MIATFGKVSIQPLSAAEFAAARAGAERLLGTDTAIETAPNWLTAGIERSSGRDFRSNGNGFSWIAGRPRVVGDDEGAAFAAEHGVAAWCAQEYARRGRSFLTLLQGPFALAVYDGDSRRTLLAVDRLGIASLFCDASNECLAFSDRLAVLARWPGTNAALAPQSVYAYLFFHMIPSPATIFERIQRLAPGTFVECDERGVHSGTYWDIECRRETGRIDFASAKAEFVAALESGVRVELESRTDVGCFLSGGTDSSTLAGMVTKVRGEPVRTYSIGFDQRGFDEIGYARIAARHFGTRHKEYYLEPRDIVRVAGRLAEIYGQPFGNSSVVPTFCCAEMAHADGVRTMLGGDGGDELFGGNQRYATQTLFSYYEMLPAALRQRVLEPMLLRDWARKITPLRKAARYIEQALVPMPERLHTYNYLHLFGRDAVFEGDFLERIRPQRATEEFAAVYDAARARTLLNKMMALDLKYTLADNDLPKVVDMCSAAGVDAVFPFLSAELVEFAARLPAAQKVNRLRLRYFFKKALADFLPQEILRKQKHGFGMPFGDWLPRDAALRELAFDSLTSLKTRGIIKPQFIEELRGERLAQHPNYYGGFIWILMVLELWLQWHFEPGLKATGT